MPNKLLLNSLSGTALYATNIIVAFLLTPFVLHALGNSAYGLWELIMSVVGYMGLLDLGIGSAMVRYVAVADGSRDREQLARIVSTSVVFFGGIGLLASLIFVGLGIYPEFFVGEEGARIAGVELLFYILAVNAVFLFPMRVFLSVLLGFQRHYFINCTRILMILLKSVIIYWYILYFDGNVLIFISLAEFAYTLASFFIFYIFLTYCKEIPRFSLATASIQQFKELFVFGSKNLLMMAASRLQNQSVPIIIAKTIGVGSIVYYAFPNRLVEYAKGFSLAIGYPLTPYFSSKIGRGDTESLGRVWLETTFVLQAIMFIMPVVLWFYGSIFLSLWIGDEYANTGRLVLKVLVLGLVADTLAVNAFRILTAQANHGRSAMLWLIIAGLSIPAGVIGGQLWGVSGVASGVILASFFGNMATLLLACSSMQVSVVKYLRATCVKLLIPLIVTVGCCQLLASSSFQVNSYWTLLIQVFGVVFLYGILIWLLALDRSMKRAVKQMLYKNIFQKLQR